MPADQTGRWPSRIGLAMTVGLVIGISLMLWWSQQTPLDNQAFDSRTWLAADAQQRGLMSLDLVVNHIPFGMRESELLELLGPPEEVREAGYFGQELPEGVVAHVYSIGSWGRHAPGSDSYLLVYLGDSRTVLEAKIDGV